MPNNDYILRSDAKNAITDQWWTEIDRVPAADVEPKRKTGVWLEEEATEDGNWRYICSVCGYTDIQSRSAQVPYCWHCGSIMQKMKVKE